MLGWDFEDEVWLRFVFELLIWPNRLLWKDELNPRVRCAFGNVLMYRPSWIWSYSRIGQFLSLGPRPILYFNCICSWLVNNLEVSFWPTSISNIYEVYRCYIYIFTKPHPVELSFSGQLPSLTFAWRPSLILITWRLQPLLLCACCFSPPCLHLLLFCQLIISTLKVTHLKSGKTQCNFWTINWFSVEKKKNI